MENLGNTCFVSAVMQAIFNVLEAIPSLPRSEAITSLWSVLSNPLANREEFLFAASSEFYRKVVAPMVDDDGNPLFPLGKQQDGEEFLNAFIESMLSPVFPHIVTQLEVRTRNTTSCLNCKHTGEHMDSSNTQFVYLTKEGVPTPPQTTSRRRGKEPALPRPEVQDLQQLLNLLTEQKEEIEIVCTACLHNTSSKSVSIETGAVLIVVIKRFQIDDTTMETSKNNSLVHVPLELVMNKEQYSLLCLVDHLGATRGNGHYVSHVRDMKTGRFHTYDDREVTQSKAGILQSESAYILIYCRQSILMVPPLAALMYS
jgi:ubiquitin C-terminal hydrolase